LVSSNLKFIQEVFKNKKSKLTCEYHLIGRRIRAKLGVKRSSGKSTLINDGKPLSSKYLDQQHGVKYAK